ncbi:MAG TPA: Os1348 family NHLP clan protein [Candidatus Limnocylindrales bacterium]|nr:Os1348 family NHLP clan protein [Candidatus Limnocylindrales bacterium]
MAGIDDVLERLVTDAGFRARLASDPSAALAGYDLTPSDLQLLSSQLDMTAGSSGGVEARTSKAGLFGLLGGVDELAEAIGGSGAGGAAADDAALATEGAPAAAKDHKEWINVESMSQPIHRSAAEEPLDLGAPSEPASAAGGEGFKREIEIDSFSLGTPSAAGLSGDLPEEGVSFVFEQIKTTYDPADQAPSPGGTGDDVLIGGTTAFDEPAAAPQPAATGDGSVDAADYVVWRKTDAPAGGDPGAIVAPTGDASQETVDKDETITIHGARTEDGTVDLQDLNQFRANFGQTAAPAADTHELEEISLTYQKIEHEGDDPAGAPSDLAADTPEPAMAIELENVQITSYQLGAHDGGDAPIPSDGLAAAGGAGGGDATTDADVDGRDFLTWQRNVGTPAGSGGVTEYTYDAAGNLDSARAPSGAGAPAPAPEAGAAADDDGGPAAEAQP